MIFSSERRSLRILHAGDLHLDSPFACLSPEKSEARRGELRETFSRLVTLAREEAVDLLLLSGDLFDSAYVSARTANRIIEEFAAMRRTQIVIAPGNHDPYTEGSLWASGRFPSNVHIFTEPELSSFTFPELNTVVWGWAFRSDRLEHSPLASHRVDDPDRLNLICGHCDLGVPLSKYGPVTQKDLANFGAQYAALGHRHIPGEPVRIGERTLAAYCGCIEGRSFDEPGKGGVYIIDAAKREGGWSLDLRRVTMALRRYETATVDISGVDSDLEVARRIKAAVEAGGFGRDTALRVTLTGATPPDFTVPREANGEALGLYYLELLDRTTPTFDAKYLEQDMSVRGKLYRSLLPYLTSGTPEERATAARALRMGMAALAGEDISLL
jgi:DNA repair exonuclease SbcCD nuclease subunit